MTTLSHGPKENGHRPAVDVLFRSAARVLGTRVIGVVLSGALDDGAAGMVAVKLRGGLGIIQDPDEALHGSMPRSAARAADIDCTLSVSKIARALPDMVVNTAPEGPPPSELMKVEAAMADMSLDAMNDPNRPGHPSGWSCPECHGSLFEIHEGGLTRYRCRVGHAWSPESLIAQQSSSLETALWVALRAVEEKASLTLNLGQRAVERGHPLTGQQFQRHAEEAREAAKVLRQLIDDISSSDEAWPRKHAGAE